MCKCIQFYTNNKKKVTGGGDSSPNCVYAHVPVYSTERRVVVAFCYSENTAIIIRWRRR